MSGSNVSLLELVENQQYEQAIHQIKENPADALRTVSGSTGTNQGNYLLHEACKNQPTLDFIDILLEANENAVRTKGQYGYLPLHFACCSRASPEVVAKLIVTYPSATRSKDDHEGKLPLHLAAKWGADDEVIMALLAVHPKASLVRDLSGKTPLEHANYLSSLHIREVVTKALRRAPILCTVSKAAMNKLAYESDAKLREIVEVYQERMAQVKGKYEQDKADKVAREGHLRRELWDEKERSSNLSEKVARLARELEETRKELDENNQIVQCIRELASKTRPSIKKQFGCDQHEQRDVPEEETREGRTDQKELAKSALREWVSTGTLDNEARNDADETREPPPSSSPPPAKSPRSAAVGSVKEWFSSEADDIGGLASRSQLIAGHRRQTGQQSSDKKESYWHPHLSSSPSSFQNQNAQRSHQPAANSLLRQSKSTSRPSALLARRDIATPQSSKGDHNSISISISHSHSSRYTRPKTPPPEQPQTQERSQQRSLSTSSRMTQNMENTEFQPNVRQKYDSKSPTRPRETYSTARASTSAYSHRILDDADESLTMDSRIEWE